MVKSRTRRERRADAPVPQTLPLLDPHQLGLLRRWVRSDAARRTYGTLIKEAGPSGIERAEALCTCLLQEGWIIRCEQLTGGTWQWDALIWRDLLRLQTLLGVAGPGQKAETRQALIDQAQGWLRSWSASATEPDPDLLDELEQATDQLADDRGPLDRLTRRLDVLRALAAWHDAGASGTRRDFALRAADGTKALSAADWRWLESGFDLERLRIARFALMAWIAGDVTLYWPAGQALPLAHLHCIGLPLTDLLRMDAAQAPQRWWLIENRASFERQALSLEPGTALLWMPGRPPLAWRQAIRHLLRLAPAPAWISADADPSGVDIACSVGELWQSLSLAWEPHRMGVTEWTATAQTWPLNTHDRRLLDNLLARAELPVGLRALCKAMQNDGRKAEQEAWL
ncbi:MAG: hypothetical protein WBA82_03270 [Castellaniella sp.]|uniref:DUF2399 domain-containing protein n=1 Tax=Castellaniella sp. TaxID=1955812 RepID=UPI003C77276B